MKYKKQVDDFYKKIPSMEEFKPIKKAIESVIDRLYVEGQVPKDALVISDETMEAFYTQAYQKYKAGHYDEALKIFRMLAALDPTVLKYLFGMASCFHMKKDFMKAAIMYHVCGTADPTDPLLYFHLSDCYANLNLRDAQTECLRLVLKYARGDLRYKEVTDRARVMIKKSAQQLQY